jgi:hypothetical protein
MARPIKETPVLKGKAAVRFMEDMEKSKDKRISKEELEKIRNNYEKLKAISKF